jgi:hypothetical protein
MKGGTRYLGMVTVSILLVLGITTYVSGGFQMPWEDSFLIGVAGFIFAFVLVIAGFTILARRQGCCSVLVKWHERLILDKVNKISRVFYRLLFRISCRSCPLASLCVGS